MSWLGLFVLRCAGSGLHACEPPRWPSPQTHPPASIIDAHHPVPQVLEGPSHVPLRRFLHQRPARRQALVLLEYGHHERGRHTLLWGEAAPWGDARVWLGIRLLVRAMPDAGRRVRRGRWRVDRRPGLHLLRGHGSSPLRRRQVPVPAYPLSLPTDESVHALANTLSISKRSARPPPVPARLLALA